MGIPQYVLDIAPGPTDYAGTNVYAHIFGEWVMVAQAAMNVVLAPVEPGTMLLRDMGDGRIFAFGQTGRGLLHAAAPEMFTVLKEINAHVGTGNDLDWHLRESGLAERIAQAIASAEPNPTLANEE
jgi:hypothetical protein